MEEGPLQLGRAPWDGRGSQGWGRRACSTCSTPRGQAHFRAGHTPRPPSSWDSLQGPGLIVPFARCEAGVSLGSPFVGVVLQAGASGFPWWNPGVPGKGSFQAGLSWQSWGTQGRCSRTVQSFPTTEAPSCGGGPWVSESKSPWSSRGPDEARAGHDTAPGPHGVSGELRPGACARPPAPLPSPLDPHLVAAPPTQAGSIPPFHVGRGMRTHLE